MDTFSLVGPERGESFEHFVSLLGIEPRVAATFRPALAASPRNGLLSSWIRWKEELFLPLLAPAFRETFGLGIRGRARELGRLDNELDSVLPPETRKQSVKAASPFFEGKAGMKGHREWQMFESRVAAGDSPGHLPVAFALQCALYHVALVPALSSYAWFEFRSREGKGIPPPPTEEEIAVFSSILPDVPVALLGETGDSGTGGSSLRIL